MKRLKLKRKVKEDKMKKKNENKREKKKERRTEDFRVHNKLCYFLRKPFNSTKW